MVQIKRIYLPPEPGDGSRFLVDRLWPRGVKKEKAELSGWVREAAPSGALRQWFGHDPAKWGEFQKRYRRELVSNALSLKPLLEAARKGKTTLLFAAKDERHNNAVVLRGWLEAKLRKK